MRSEWRVFLPASSQLSMYIHVDSEVIMVLCDDCDIKMIGDAANKNGFKMSCIETKQSLIEKNFIYKIVRKDSVGEKSR